MARIDTIAIVGPTASGKTALAIELAERYNGEIICADSRTVYRHMDIGTAKPTAEEQTRIRHWGLDITEPGQPFTVADFKTYAQQAIRDIHSRGKRAFIVGGTGLYVDSLLYDYQFGSKPNPVLRQQLESTTVEQLQIYCNEHNIILPENSQNKRHLVRAIERAHDGQQSRKPLSESSIIVGIATRKELLRTRIVQRTEQLFAQKVVEEAILLGEKYGWSNEAMTGNIYPLLKLHLEGKLPIDDVKIKFATADIQLAKRQMTWFRRNPDILWSTLLDASAYVDAVLAGE
jgi:tRNA dimethylallyltransferase